MAEITLNLSEADFVDVDGPAKVEAATSNNLSEQLATESKVDYVAKRLFTVAFKKLGEYTPDGYHITEASFDVSLEGSPFGVGVSGNVSVTISPKSG